MPAADARPSSDRARSRTSIDAATTCRCTRRAARELAGRHAIEHPRRRSTASCVALREGVDARSGRGARGLRRAGRTTRADTDTDARPGPRPSTRTTGRPVHHGHDRRPRRTPTEPPRRRRRSSRRRGPDDDRPAARRRHRRRVARRGGRRLMAEPSRRRPLRARRPPRRRRHVDRPARLRPPARAPRRGQAAGRAPGRRRPVRRALPPRGAGRRAPRAPQRRAGLRLRPRRGQRTATTSSWSASTGQSVRRDAARPRPAAGCDEAIDDRRARPAAGWTTRTATASSTATSSPATSCVPSDGDGQARRLRHRQGHQRASRRSRRSARCSGTAAYLAPEQAAGEEVGPAARTSTRWASSTYQLLSGGCPTRRTSLTELALKQQRETRRAWTSSLPGAAGARHGGRPGARARPPRPLRERRRDAHRAGRRRARDRPAGLGFDRRDLDASPAVRSRPPRPAWRRRGRHRPRRDAWSPSRRPAASRPRATSRSRTSRPRAATSSPRAAVAA